MSTPQYLIILWRERVHSKDIPYYYSLWFNNGHVTVVKMLEFWPWNSGSDLTLWTICWGGDHDNISLERELQHVAPWKSNWKSFNKSIQALWVKLGRWICSETIDGCATMKSQFIMTEVFEHNSLPTSCQWALNEHDYHDWRCVTELHLQFCLSWKCNQ